MLFFLFHFINFIHVPLLPLREFFSILESQQKFVCFSGKIGKLVRHGVLLKIGFISFSGPLFSFFIYSYRDWSGMVVLLY